MTHAAALLIVALAARPAAPLQDAQAPAPQPIPVHPDNLPPAPHLDNGETLWPQEATEGGRTYVLYTPQFESLSGTACAGRAAFSVSAPGTSATYGILRFTAAADNDAPAGLIEISDMVVKDARLSSGRDADAATVALQKMLLGMHFTVERSVALATMAAEATARASAPALNGQVPPIRVVDRASVLLLLDGPPVLRRIDGGVGIALNTPSLLAYDPASRTWLTRIGASTWLSAPAYAGPFSATKAPDAAVAQAIAKALPPRHGEAAPSPDPAPQHVPQVVVSTTPLCLVSIAGQPDLTQVADGLYAVRNANCDLFTDSSTGNWWLLASGRWFAASDPMKGPWKRVPAAELPGAFGRIDPHGTWGNVLAAVPGTASATDALYQQEVPHVATLDRSKAKASVTTIGGAARFSPIAGTALLYATNANVPLIECMGGFYACQDGAWFAAPAASGPWALCDRLPDAIATIPASAPVYGCTFVRVVDATAETVTFSYTAGYMGGFVDGDVAVYGTGYSVPGTSVPDPDAGTVPGSDATWGDYAGWPATYGWWPSFGYAGWTCGSFPGWVDYSLQPAAMWCAPGWWGPGASFGAGFALGMDWGGAWHWGYHPWGAQAGNSWWASHWGGAYRRGWSTAARGGNRAAGGGSVDQVSARWAHAGGVPNDVSATADGRIAQQRGPVTFVRGEGGWQRDDGRPASPQTPTRSDAASGNGGGFRERDGSAAGAAAARGSTMDRFRPDPNHNFDGSPRGAFARGETNYADRQEGLEPSSPGAQPQPYARGGSWNGGGWDRPDRTPTSAGYGPNGDSYTGWNNGERGYGASSGYTGARGIVRRPSGGDGYAAFEGGGMSSGYTGGIGYQPRGTGLSSGYTGGLGEDDGSTGLRSGYSGGLEGNGMTPGVRSGYSGGGAGLNYSMWGYGMVGGGIPQYTWMGAWPGWGCYGGFYGGYRGGYRGGMSMMRGGGGGRR
jgi:hypothetical protein